jgi:uncharacterized membrane protein YccC
LAERNEVTRLRDDVERYRRAAEDALEQLDWCIGYLHGASKGQIAAALARNRAHIRENLLQRSAEPVPSDPKSGAANPRHDKDT